MSAAGCRTSEEAVLEASGTSELIGKAASGLAREGATAQGLEGRHDRYPLVLAPTIWVERQELVASDAGLDDNFASALALTTDTVLVGAPRGDGASEDVGAAYVFARSADTAAEVAKLAASDGALADQFGGSVALSGQLLIIGAPLHDGVASNAGAAYVFERNANSWIEKQVLKASDAAADDRFGASVAASDEVLVVGAPAHDGAANNAGAAYVFARSASLWSEVEVLMASDGVAAGYFGTSVAVSGDTALIGSPGYAGSGSSTGAAYAFVRSAGLWPSTETQHMGASDSAAYTKFGASVALSGDVAFVGAPYHDGAVSNSGAAYVLERNAGLWPATETQRLLASDIDGYNHFGTSVAASADILVVGARGSDVAGAFSGAAYAFGRSAAAWDETQQLIASDGAASDSAGSAVALAGEMALLGAPGHDEAGRNAGAAYLVALKLAVGAPCSANEACAGAHCVDGVCCGSACGEACQACDLSGLEGQCTTLPRAAAPSESCGGYLCNGDLSACPAECMGDSDCTSDRYCQNRGACVPKAVDASACGAANACISGHCIDGVCCNEACDQGCGSCLVSGSVGACLPVEAAQSGVPDCAPYLCRGDSVSCPVGCVEQSDCAPGNHCAEKVCEPDGAPGAGCTVSSSCASGHCTDGLCCLTDSCGGYRCGAAGACELSCRSSAQCASGYECSSQGNCELRSRGAGHAESVGGCHAASPARSQPRSRQWPWALLGLSLWAGAWRLRQGSNCRCTTV